MPISNGALLQLILSAFGLTLWWTTTPIWKKPTRLPKWEATPSDFLLIVITVLLAIFIGSQMLLRAVGPGQPDNPADILRMTALSAVAFHLSGLAAWLVLRETVPAAKLPAAPLPVAPAARDGVTGFLKILPVLLAVGSAWYYILRLLHFPTGQQELVDLFAGGGSPVYLSLLALFAIVIAPINEELLFRGAIFGFLRTRISPTWAKVISSALFALLHWNWLSFVPLFILGWFLCSTYEKSGSLKANMILHATFNLNTLLFIVLGGQG